MPRGMTKASTDFGYESGLLSPTLLCLARPYAHHPEVIFMILSKHRLAIHPSATWI